MAYKYTNFVEGVLDASASGISDTDTTIAVDFATNSVIPTGLSGSNYMMFVIDPEGAEHAPEVVKATNITGSSNPYTLTVTRNEESSGAKAFDAGRKIVGAVTAAQLTNFATKDATVFTGDVTIPDGDLILGSTAVTSTAAELNKLDGVTATTAELNTVAGVTAGTVSASKALVADANVNVSSSGHVTAQSGGADSGIVLGQTFNSSYVGLRTAGMSETSGDEYVIMSNGSHTFVSAGTDGDVSIVGGPNNTSCRIKLDTSENQIDINGAVTADGAVTVAGLLTANGGLTLQDGDTFTFDGESLTDCIDTGEAWTRTNSAIATVGAIIDQFLQYDVEGGADQGATLYIQNNAPYSDGAVGGVKGDIWIDT